MQTIETTIDIHPFEKAGLGEAPFRYIGVTDATKVRKIGKSGMSTTCGGTCEYCGRAIAVLCHFESADGRAFVVGSDCAKKTGATPDALRRDLVKRKKNAKIQKDADAAWAALRKHRTALEATPYDMSDDFGNWAEYLEDCLRRNRKQGAKATMRILRELGVGG